MKELDYTNIIEVFKLSHLTEPKTVCFMDCRNLKDGSEIEKLNKDEVKILSVTKNGIIEIRMIFIKLNF